MLNKELFMVFVPGIAWILGSLGGTHIGDGIPGWKGWRRFILPAVFGLAVLLAGFSWWQSLLVIACTVGANCLGYGQNKTWLQRSLVGLAFLCITLPIGISVWNFITMLGFLGLFYLSNFTPTSNVFVWKLVEGLVFLLCGIQLAYLLIGKGLIW